MKPEKHQQDSSTQQIESICKQYGVEVSYDEFCLNIEFKDGKTLSYVFGVNGTKTILQDILDGIHGRVFKDNKFIGYAPKCKSLEEILVNVDMMM